MLEFKYFKLVYGYLKVQQLNNKIILLLLHEFIISTIVTKLSFAFCKLVFKISGLYILKRYECSNLFMFGKYLVKFSRVFGN